MKKKLTVFEMIWYFVTSAIILWGLTYTVLGVITRFLSTSAPLYEANESIKKAFGLGFFWWGIILLWVGVIAAVIVLLIRAHKTDNKVEKASKRAARLAEINEQVNTETSVQEAK